MAKLEAESARLKSLDVAGFPKRLEAYEQKQNQLSGQLTGLTQMQKDAASKQEKISLKQWEMRDQIEKIKDRLSD